MEFDVSFKPTQNVPENPAVLAKIGVSILILSRSVSSLANLGRIRFFLNRHMCLFSGPPETFPNFFYQKITGLTISNANRKKLGGFRNKKYTR